MDNHDTFHLKKESLPNDIVQQMLALPEDWLF